MTQHSFAKPKGSVQPVASQFPIFGVFIIRKKDSQVPNRITESTQANSLYLFPNPTSGKFKISIDDKIQAITIYDHSGKTAYIKRFVNETPPNEWSFYELDRGIYFIKVQTSTKLFTTKLLVND